MYLIKMLMRQRQGWLITVTDIAVFLQKQELVLFQTASKTKLLDKYVSSVV